MVLTIIIFIFVLGLLILVHEFGHFLAAVKAGIKVEEFGLGFPPKIYAKKIGQTRFSINLIPLGGFVKLYGESGEHVSDPKSFFGKPLVSRFWVITAGVLMNLFLGWLLFSFGFATGLPVTVTDPATIPGAKITKEIVVSETVKGSPAEKAGLSQGDIILGSETENFETPEQLTSFTQKNMGKAVILKIKSYGKIKNLPVTLSGDKKAPLGVGVLEAAKVQVPFWQAPWLALKEVGKLIALVFLALGQIIKTLFVAGHVQEGAGVGPIGLWFIFQTAAKLGLSYIVQLTALVSVNLAIVNILPLPALDGGRLIFWGIEAVSKKRVTSKIENLVHTIGFVLLLALLVLISVRDVINFTR